MLVDIGAGIGFFSLAAAARGHAALAFELAPNSVESLQASIDYNGFGKLVTVHQVRSPPARPLLRVAHV